MHYTGHKQPVVSHTSTDHHRNSSREVWFTGTEHTSWGPPVEVKAECKQEDSEDLGYVPWLESVGGELCGSQTRVRLVNSNPKTGVQSRGFIWGAHKTCRCWEAATHHKGCWEALSGAPIFLWLWSCFPGHTLVWWGCCQFKVSAVQLA